MPNDYEPGTVVELEFDRVPTKDELRRTVEDSGLHCYRFIKESADHLTYQVQAVDFYASLKRNIIPTTDDTWIVPATISCRFCKAQHKGWLTVAKKWEDNKPYYRSTEYCPLCLPTTVDLWLAGLGIQKDKPTLLDIAPIRPRHIPQTTLSIDMEDFD